MCDFMLISRSTTSGKSSLVIQFTENQFIESYYPTIENSFTKSISYKGVDYDCEIMDTAGQVCIRVLHVTLSH
jgi:Ras family protein